jgi:ATP-dependent Lon protease
MSLFDQGALTAADRKARSIYGDQVVVKALAQEAAFHRLPRFVSEYLLAKFVRPESWQQDLEKIKARIKDALPELGQRELLKERLLRTGEITIIDLVEARVDLRNQQRWAQVPAVQDDRVRVGEQLLTENPGLLLGGLWGTVKLRFTPEKDPTAPIEMVSFTAFQVGPPDIANYKAKRSQFTTEEWTHLLLQSAGYNAAGFPRRRQQLLVLARLAPLVERNLNMVELGPRQTGKTFLLRNVSPRVFTVSGGKTSPANLFVNLNTKAIGILGTRKVVVFDEVANTSFGDEDATISTLKDYMESGQFSRGNRSYATDASLSFAGNLDVEGEMPHSQYRHLFEPLPSSLIDSAFLDRIHGYLPGWEVPKITPAALAQGAGFVTDFFGEVLVKLRDDDYQHLVRGLPWTSGMTKRDVVAVERIGSALIKILYPDERLTKEELREVATLACELRQRVHNQLCQIAPGEFKPRLIGFQGLEEHMAPDLRNQSAEILPRDDHLNREAVVGAVTGLGVLLRDGKPIGGDLILVQVAALAGFVGLEVAGLHGPVLRDSVQTAYNIARRNCNEFGVPERRFKEQRVAVHLVRIAEPKDGPSAGVAFVTGIVSALTGRAVRPACAMTGEVTLFGEVTAVGGINHKIQAAVRAGRKLVFIPADNAKEITTLPEEILRQVEIVPVKKIQQVLERALMPGTPG